MNRSQLMQNYAIAFSSNLADVGIYRAVNSVLFYTRLKMWEIQKKTRGSIYQRLTLNLLFGYFDCFFLFLWPTLCMRKLLKLIRVKIAYHVAQSLAYRPTFSAILNVS